MPPPAFVTDPAGNADVKVPFQIALEFVRITREAVNDGSRELTGESVQNRDEIVMRRALMQKQRQPMTNGQCNLGLESATLCIAWRKVAEIIKPALPRRHDAGGSQETVQFGFQRGIEIGCMMGVHAHGRAEYVRAPRRQVDRRATVIEIGPGHDNTRHTRLAGTSDDFCAIRIETVVGQIGADIYQACCFVCHGSGYLLSFRRGLTKEGPMTDSDWTTYVLSGAAWRRFGIMLLLMPILACVSFFIIFTAFFQFFSVLSKGETSPHLCRSGADLGRYAAAIIDFLTYHSDARPFPFDGRVMDRAADTVVPAENAAPPAAKPVRKKPASRKVATRKKAAVRKKTTPREKPPDRKPAASKPADKAQADAPSSPPPIDNTTG